MDDLIYTFGVLSIVFYSVCYFPQMYVIVKNRSSSGVSIASILLWTQADVLSFIATLLLNLHLTLVLVGFYNVVIGFVMTFVVYRYTESKKPRLTFVVTTINALVCIVLWASRIVNEPVGTTLGWMATFVYVVGRIPQIASNYKGKDTGEVSIAMYVCTIIGNVCYIIACSLDPENVLPNLPWIVSTVLSTALDFFIIFQVWLYSKKHLVEIV